MPHPSTSTAQRWDIFCRVVDNFGDIGVCWRLASQLAERGLAVRLIVDDASALDWMAPQGAAGVQVLPWPGPVGPGDVVIEAFGCDPPESFVQAMSQRPRPPVWINLEYLSAEGYVERSHGLRSPQRCGLDKWFFYPGFTARTGGLLREPALAERQGTFDRHRWLRQQGVQLAVGERVVSLFCYDNPALPALLQDLARQPTLLLLTPGPAQLQVQGLQLAGGLRTLPLPWLSQSGFDQMLWSCELNVVRGEDSLVRAIWVGAPFVWQAYPQHDGAHHAKVEAMLTQAGLPEDAKALWRAWNAEGGLPWPGLPEAGAWAAAHRRWRQSLLGQADLASQLLAFAAAKGIARP